MEVFKSSLFLVPALAIALMVAIMPVHGQISTSCSPSMISSFTPCMNFVTNSSGNGTSPPSADCCNALKNLTSSGMGCLCLIVTGSSPFQIPINRTLAISLPRACNMPGVPLQCKATGAPVPAPSPASFGPTLSPAAPPSSPVGGGSASPALAPESDTTPALTPESPTVNSGVPATTTGSPTAQTPSAGNHPQSFSPSLVLFILGIMFINYY